MWSNPRFILRYNTALIWNRIVHNKVLEEMPRIEISGPPVSDQAVETFEEMLEFFLSLAAEGVAAGYTDSEQPPDAFHTEAGRYLLQLARRVERTGDYRLLPSLWAIVLHLWKSAVDRPKESLKEQHLIFMMQAIQGIRLLLGSETKLLSGVRHNHPAWQTLSAPLTSEGAMVAFQAHDNMTSSFSYMLSVGPEDLEVVPDPYHQIDSPDDTPPGSLAYVRTLLEDAFYNQRYVVDRHGAYVSIPRHPLFLGMFLRVRSSESDPNYLDFLARFDTAQGSFMYVMNGPRVTHEAVEDELMIEANPYLYMVIAQIYHDLVTAKEIRVRSASRESPPPAARRSDGPLEQWIYIPRVIKHRARPPRQKLDQPRVMAPHSVSGHRRKGNLSDEHREELERFERETGLQVLRWLPEGYTFVRPHVSPKEYGVAHLPRFIRRRLQQDLINQLKAEVILPAEPR